MFEFNRTVEWNPPPLNGQKVTCEFRLKQPEIVVSAEDIALKAAVHVDCNYCEFKSHCDARKEAPTSFVGCKRQWLEYLTGKEVTNV